MYMIQTGFHKKFLVLSCMALALGVIVGAFGAHGLQDKLTIKQLGTYDTAVKYWFYNSLGLLGLSILGYLKNLGHWPSIVIFIGMLIFCMALWLNALLAMPVFGMVAPIGWLTMVVGWIFAGFSINKNL